MANRTDRIAALLREGTGPGGVPGVAVAAVFPDGEIVSAAAAMQLVEQGKLSLDAPIASVLPRLAGLKVPEVREARIAVG